MRMACNGEVEMAVEFSQGQNLTEVAREVQDIFPSTKRWLKLVSATPVGSLATSTRGKDRTESFRMAREFYDACLDPGDYRTLR